MTLLKGFFVVFAALCALVLSPSVGSQPKHIIRGAVLDKDNHPIPGVLVSVNRGGHHDETHTDQDGKFSISFDPGPPLELVKYDANDWNPSTISNLSGARDHDITKVLQPVGSKLSYEEQLELSASLELIYAADYMKGANEMAFATKFNRVIFSAKNKNRGFADLLGPRTSTAMAPHAATRPK